jgi:hypothetical protein
MIKQEIITIEYSAHQDFNFEKAFKPDVYVNGKWIYTISRCKKTMRGALNNAKRLAEGYAKNYPNNAYCKAVIQQRDVK